MNGMLLSKRNILKNERNITVKEEYIAAMYSGKHTKTDKRVCKGDRYAIGISLARIIE